MSLEKKASSNMRYETDDDVDDEALQKQKQEKEGVYRYTHLNDEDRTLVNQLFRGCIELEEVPDVRANIVKVFISSTFTDMEAERNALAEHVYPRLRESCRDKYGIDFQAIDMRWGVPIEASEDHSATDLCLAELHHCQSSSVGPNFVAFIGQRYGYIPIPASILRAEYEVIESHVRKTSPADADLLNKCFLKDQNVHPNLFRLQTCSYITGKIRKPWKETEVNIKRILRSGGQSALEANEISRAFFRQMKASVTEHEIYEGLIGINRQKDRDNNAIVYIRDFQDLHRNLHSKKANRYVEVIGNPPEMNPETKSLLDDLKAKSKEKLSSNNYLNSSISWKESGIDPKFHAPYLQRMCNHFERTVNKLVERNVFSRRKLDDDSLYHEVLQHWSVLKGRCETFVGREDELTVIQNYILSSQSSQPLVVFGPSGSGKTSLLAKGAILANGILTQEELAKPAVIVRFLGTTPDSSSIQQLLYSVCHQLAFVANRNRSDVPEDFLSLKVYFRNLVLEGDFTGRVLIVLDALNQLSTNQNGHKLDWLPARHATNVRIIVSTIPFKFKILDRLMNRIHNNFIHTEPLPTKDCEDIVKILLDRSERKLTYEQWKTIRKSFQSCTLPLFVTLTFEEAKRWHSYDQSHENVLTTTVESCIHTLFERLEKKHGKMFVAKALSYITAARDGLSESELEDILSLDDEVLNSIFVMWLPPIRRLPPSLWSRLQLDIGNFLLERDADGTVVLSWFHQQFVNVVTERYLEEYLPVIEIHRLIEQYYMGMWAGVKKHFTYTKQQMSRLDIRDEHGSALRHVPKQPMLFNSEGVPRYNVRKLKQVPYSLLHSRQLSRLKGICLCNYEWIYYKMKATSLQTLLADYALIDDKECNLIADALRMTGSVLSIDVHALVPELTGRLLPHTSKYAYIKQLVGQCDLVARYHCPLVPNCQIYTAPGGPLQFECEINAKPTARVEVDVFQSPVGVLMTAKPFYNTNVQVWELNQAEPRQDFKMNVGKLYPSKDGRYISTFKNNRFVLVYKTDGGELHGEIDYEYGVANSVTTSKRLLAFITDRGIGPYVVDVKDCVLLHKFSYNCSTCVISANESFLVLSSQKHLFLYEIPLMERKCVTRMSDEVKLIRSTKDELKYFAMTQSNLLYSVHFDLGIKDATLNDIISDFDIKDFVMSHAQNLILVRAARCLYLIDAHEETLKLRLQKMPEGAFVETMSTFSAAGFTPNDEMIVASRYTYIAVWDSRSGEPLRLLLASVSPIIKIFTCDTLNKTIALLKNNMLQVWDMNNLGADVQHANKVVRGRVLHLALSSTSRKAICSSDRLPPAVTVVDLGSGDVHHVFPYSPEREDKIIKLEMSPTGKYCVVRGKQSSHATAPILWSILSDDLIYDMSLQETFHLAINNRYVLFDRSSSYIACVQALSYVPCDWIGNSYVVKIFQPDHFYKKPTELTIPSNTEFVCKPLIFSSGKYHAFVALYQTCKVISDPISRIERGRVFESRLSLLNVSSTSSERNVTVKSLLRTADEKDKFVDIRATLSNKLVLIYAKNTDYFQFDNKCGLMCPLNVEKCAILYDPKTDFLLRHLPFILTPSVNVSSCAYSKHGSIILSDQLEVFRNSTKGFILKVSTEVIDGSAKLVLDGQYIVAICKTGKIVLVMRSSDGETVGKLFIHGQASCLEVGEDDRTILVGCNDGRVMILTLIIECEDPVKDIISKLPTRTSKPMADTLKLLDRDVIKSKYQPGIARSKKAPNFKTICKAVTMTQKAAKIQSQACSIQ